MNSFKKWTAEEALTSYYIFSAPYKCQAVLGQRLVHYICTVRIRTVSTFDCLYYLHPAQNRNLGGHQFKDDGYLDTRDTMADNTGEGLLATENRNDTRKKSTWILTGTILKTSARSKARFCGRSLPGNTGSNLTGGVDTCLFWALSVVRYRSPRRADHSSRGVQCVWVWSWSFDNEEVLAH